MTASPHSGKLQPSMREILWLREGKVCFWCRTPTRYSTTNRHQNRWYIATIDHVIPRYRGGTNDESNLVSACNRCNRRRSYEDQMGLPEGSLLGRYPPTREERSLHRTRRRTNGVTT